MQKLTKSHRQAFVSMYRWLVGNLRLWTIQELVSRYGFIQSKAYRTKQEFSQCGYVCPYFEQKVMDIQQGVELIHYAEDGNIVRYNRLGEKY